MNMALLVSNKVTKRFGGLEAVSKVDLEVPENAIYSIIGPNGAGKTTFFNCITGFYKPDGGDIQFYDRSLVGFAPDQITYRGISRTYQNIRPFANMTALENIMVGEHPRMNTLWFEALLQTPRQRKE